MIETLGAEVLRVKTVPYSDPNHYQKIAGRLARGVAGRHLGESVRQHCEPRRARTHDGS